jgi:hypothetical protein
MHGFERDDGLFEIEGRVTDLKSMPFVIPEGPTVEPGKPIHDMWIRLVIDDEYIVHDVLAVSDATPYRMCPAAAANLKRINGVRIASGWSREVKARLGGAQCCTHLREMLIPLGSAAFQTLVVARRRKPVPLDKTGKPRSIDSCFAYASDGDVVARRWPEHYTGQCRDETA